MADPLVSMDLFALATLPKAADEAGGPPPTKFYELRDNLGPAEDTHNENTEEMPALQAA
jgi:hypothetical protein